MRARSDGHSRIHFFFAITLLLFGVVFYRLFILAYVNHSFYARIAEANIDHINNILARGNIYIANGIDVPMLAATNKKFPVIGVVPSKIPAEQKDEIIRSLVAITEVDEKTVEKAVRSDSVNLKVIARRINADQVARIKNLNNKDISISYEMDRFYPNNGLAADVLGFLGYDGNSRAGQYGIEASYDRELFGKDEPATEEKISLFTKWFAGGKNKTEIVTRPNDVILTIDNSIQSFAEKQLDALMKKWSAIAGSVIIQEPKTGKILAMADRPSFDPNVYSSAETRSFLNSNVQEIFEPGSSFKPFTIATGLDLGKITPQTTYEDTGSVTVGGYTIKNFSNNVFGTSTMSQVLEKSINTGAMYVENLVGDDNFTNYVINMGFGQKTGISLPGEVNGNIANLYSGRKINHLTASFGQGIAVTPLQLTNAYSMIANGGKLMRPYIVDKVIHEGGREDITQPEIIGIPLSEKTAAKLQGMLTSVVKNGFDKARITGYDIAGKTGTAQIADGKGGYLENQYIHNFVGFAPAHDARFTIMIKIDKPQGITFAADSLSPTFKEIAQFMLQYYNIPPTLQ
ncbi:MAG: penicillin-binding protein 2 [Patescibacteria group bacterium]